MDISCFLNMQKCSHAYACIWVLIEYVKGEGICGHLSNESIVLSTNCPGIPKLKMGLLCCLRPVTSINNDFEFCFASHTAATGLCSNIPRKGKHAVSKVAYPLSLCPDVCQFKRNHFHIQ